MFTLTGRMSLEQLEGRLEGTQFTLVTSVFFGIPTVPLVNWSKVVTDAIWTVVDAIASVLINSVIGVAGVIFAQGTKVFLFFPPPDQIAPLEAVYTKFLVIFWALLPAVGATFFLMNMLFPEKQEADIYRFMERVFVAVIALIVTSPLLPGPDLFSLTVSAVNELGLFIFPKSYSLGFLKNNLNSLIGAIGNSVAGAGALVAVAFIGTNTIIGVVLVVIVFYLVLGMRMLLIYVVYAMMPLLLALWVVDIGPLKYGKMVATMVWKVTAILLLMGIVISAILATTGAIADPNGNIAFTNQTFGSPPGGIVNGTGQVNTNANSVSASSGPPSGVSKLLLQLFAWIGGIVLSIALTTSALGMVISMRGSGSVGSRARRGRKSDAPTGTQVFSGSNEGEALTRKTGGGGDGGFTSPEVTSTSDGDTVVQTENTGMIFDGDENNVSTFPPSDPDPVDEEVPLKEKADHLASKYTGGGYDKAKGTYQGKKKDIDKFAEKKSSWGTDKEENMTEKYGTAGKVVGKAANAAVTSIGYTPKAATTKLGSLTKRGGKAYWNVFKQPTVGESIGEAARIARASPIGKPNRPDDGARSSGKGGAGDSGAPEDIGGLPDTIGPRTSADPDDYDRPEGSKGENQGGKGGNLFGKGSNEDQSEESDGPRGGDSKSYSDGSFGQEQSTSDQADVDPENYKEQVKPNYMNLDETFKGNEPTEFSGYGSEPDKDSIRTLPRGDGSEPNGESPMVSGNPPELDNINDNASAGGSLFGEGSNEGGRGDNLFGKDSNGDLSRDSDVIEYQNQEGGVYTPREEVYDSPEPDHFDDPRVDFEDLDGTDADVIEYQNQEGDVNGSPEPDNVGGDQD